MPNVKKLLTPVSLRLRQISRVHRLLVWGVGTPALALAVVALAPGWWWHLVATSAAAARRHWLPVLLFTVAAASFITAAARWWGGPGRIRRQAGQVSINLRIPLFLHAMALLALAVVAATGLGWLLWQFLGQPDILPSRAPQPAPSAPVSGATQAGWTVANTFEAIKIVLAIVAGIGGVVALTVAYRKQDLGEAAEHREDTKLFTDRFGKAADQLGSEHAAVRLAGVYAMSRLADDWTADQQTCIDVLCAYLRMPSTVSGDSREPSAATGTGSPAGITHNASDAEKEIRATIIRLIAAHLQKDARQSWQGRAFDLTGAEMDNVDFTGITVEPGTDLQFHGTRFSKLINFRGAQFVGGNVDFLVARFDQCFVNFMDANFASGSVDFYGVTFADKSRFSFTDAKFAGASVRFNQARFVGGSVNFRGAHFNDGNVDFTMPSSWDVPPTFPDFPEGPPPSLLLPPEK